MTTPTPLSSTHAAVPGPSTQPRTRSTSAHRPRLGGAEAAVVVAVIALAALLAATGMPHDDVFLVLGGAGLLAIILIQIATGALSRALRSLFGSER